jgi:hypothetical protein
MVEMLLFSGAVIIPVAVDRVSPNFRLKRKEAKRKRKKVKRNSEKSVCFASFRKEAKKAL